MKCTKLQYCTNSNLSNRLPNFKFSTKEANQLKMGKQAALANKLSKKQIQTNVQTELHIANQVQCQPTVQKLSKGCQKDIKKYTNMQEIWNVQRKTNNASNIQILHHFPSQSPFQKSHF